MSSSPIFSHVIGSVALLICASLMTFAFTVIGSSLIYDLVRPQLQEVSDYVTKSLLDLMALAKEANQTNLVMVKEIQFPTNVESFGYNIRLSARGSAYLVTVSSDRFGWLSGQTEIAIRQQEANVDLGSGDVGIFVNGRKVMKSPVIQSGRRALVWTKMDLSGLQIGLGFYSGP